MSAEADPIGAQFDALRVVGSSDTVTLPGWRWNAIVQEWGDGRRCGDLLQSEVDRLRWLYEDAHRQKRELTAIVVQQRERLAAPDGTP